MFINIPDELQRLDQWVVANADKIPLNPRTLEKADVTNPETWGSFSHACNAGLRHVGFVLSKTDPYSIIDLDKPDNELQAARHTLIYDSFDSYTELSQSGNGVHIIVRGQIPAGVRRDKVELYSDSRYMICTGNILKPFPIADYQTILDAMYEQMKPDLASVELTQTTGTLTDEQIYDMANNAANGHKFHALWQGQWQAMNFPSQSEADFALLSMLTFYTPDNEQVRRMFRFSQLGQRDKATRNDKYLDRVLMKMRAKEIPQIDFSAILKSKPNAKADAEIQGRNETGERIDAQYPAPETLSEEIGDAARSGDNPPSPECTVATDSKLQTSEGSAGVTFPAGFIGDCAEYIYGSAIRPVREIALAAAIALAAGVVGRAYNVSGSGLNQYIILLAKTGSGKEGAATGIDALVTAVRSQCPMVDEFIGPGAFASGQALIRALDKKHCFVSVLGEFGLTLQGMSDPKANQAQVMLKKVLLDIYAKSGFTKVLRSSVYSEIEKNTQIIQAPNITILGESTPEVFYSGLDASSVSEGLIPRFSILEYVGERPATNQNAFEPPPKELVDQFAQLLAVALSAQQNRAYCAVMIIPDAKAMLDAFDTEATGEINNNAADVERQLWNRAHLKALKLAALVAVGINSTAPAIDTDCAQWAIDLVRNDIKKLLRKFQQGNVGGGDLRMEGDVVRAVDSYLSMTPQQRLTYSLNLDNAAKDVVPLDYLRRRCRSLNSFRTDRRGPSLALSVTLTNLCEAAVLTRVNPVQAAQFGFNHPIYIKGDAWKA